MGDRLICFTYRQTFRDGSWREDIFHCFSRSEFEIEIHWRNTRDSGFCTYDEVTELAADIEGETVVIGDREAA